MTGRSLALALLLLGAALPVRADESSLHPAPVLAEDGFYHPDWFLMSFLDLGEDVRDAAKQGKRVAIMVEQRGCAACKRVHEVNLRHPRIVEQLRRSFEI
ncbi:MAG: thioredoxin, partial [Magnetospirillum sp.]